jgi:hypothetical protein
MRSSAIDELIDNETAITLPMFDSFSGNGSNTQVDVSGFVGFVITDYVATGPSDSRYVEGHFTQTVCGNNCQLTNSTTPATGNLAKIRLIR